MTYRKLAVILTPIASALAASDSAGLPMYLIQESVERVSAGATLVDDSGKAVSPIMESVRKVAAIVGEIAAASR